MSDNRLYMGFYFQHESGDKLYPLRMKNRDTGQGTFRISKHGNKKKDGEETLIIEEMEQKVFTQGYSVRASTTDGRRCGLYSPSGRSICSVVKIKPRKG